MIKTVLDTAPVKKPITIDGDNGIKEHMNLDQDLTFDDRYVEDLIKVALDYVESLTGRRLITQTWLYYLMDWPKGDYFIMPFGQLKSITHIKYTDVDNSQSTWSSAEYIAEITSDPGRVVLASGYTWPSTNLYPSNPVEIKFVCGYGDNGDDCPPSLLHPIKILVAELYENREVTILGLSKTKLDWFDNMFSQFKLDWL